MAAEQPRGKSQPRLERSGSPNISSQRPQRSSDRFVRSSSHNSSFSRSSSSSKNKKGCLGRGIGVRPRSSANGSSRSSQDCNTLSNPKGIPAAVRVRRSRSDQHRLDQAGPGERETGPCKMARSLILKHSRVGPTLGGSMDVRMATRVPREEVGRGMGEIWVADWAEADVLAHAADGCSGESAYVSGWKLRDPPVQSGGSVACPVAGPICSNNRGGSCRPPTPVAADSAAGASAVAAFGRGQVRETAVGTEPSLRQHWYDLERQLQEEVEGAEDEEEEEDAKEESGEEQPQQEVTLKRRGARRGFVVRVRWHRLCIEWRGGLRLRVVRDRDRWTAGACVPTAKTTSPKETGNLRKGASIKGRQRRCHGSFKAPVGSCSNSFVHPVACLPSTLDSVEKDTLSLGRNKKRHLRFKPWPWG